MHIVEDTHTHIYRQMQIWVWTCKSHEPPKVINDTKYQGAQQYTSAMKVETELLCAWPKGSRGIEKKNEKKYKNKLYLMITQGKIKE